MHTCSTIVFADNRYALRSFAHDKVKYAECFISVQQIFVLSLSEILLLLSFGCILANYLLLLNLGLCN